MSAEHDRNALLRAITAAPDDDLPRLIFADHLDETGEAAWAQFVRMDCEQVRLLAEPNENPPGQFHQHTRAVAVLRHHAACLLSLHPDNWWRWAGLTARPPFDRITYHRGMPNAVDCGRMEWEMHCREFYSLWKELTPQVYLTSDAVWSSRAVGRLGWRWPKARFHMPREEDAWGRRWVEYSPQTASWVPVRPDSPEPAPGTVVTFLWPDGEVRHDQWGFPPQLPAEGRPGCFTVIWDVPYVPTAALRLSPQRDGVVNSVPFLDRPAGRLQLTDVRFTSNPAHGTTTVEAGFTDLDDDTARLVGMTMAPPRRVDFAEVFPGLAQAWRQQQDRVRGSWRGRAVLRPWRDPNPQQHFITLGGQPLRANDLATVPIPVVHQEPWAFSLRTMPEDPQIDRAAAEEAGRRMAERVERAILDAAGEAANRHRERLANPQGYTTGFDPAREVTAEDIVRATDEMRRSGMLIPYEIQVRPDLEIREAAEAEMFGVPRMRNAVLTVRNLRALGEATVEYWRPDPPADNPRIFPNREINNLLRELDVTNHPTGSIQLDEAGSSWVGFQAPDRLTITPIIDNQGDPVAVVPATEPTGEVTVRPTGEAGEDVSESEVTEVCPVCYGTGQVNGPTGALDDVVTCPTCQGRTVVTRAVNENPDPNGRVSFEEFDPPEEDPGLAEGVDDEGLTPFERQMRDLHHLGHDEDGQ